jgi:ferric-dicitrate binding protein FerR (iron transport regulator)
MEKYDDKEMDGTFLADWLAGAMSDDELKSRVSGEDFAAYQTLRRSTRHIEVPAPDMARNFAAVQSKIEARKKPHRKPRAVRLYRYVAVAAVVVLGLAIFELYWPARVCQTVAGQTKTVVLDDGSTARLNAGSRISYPNLFAYNRTLGLEGEAYFDVKKGRRFTVETRCGSVLVLGTAFSVTARGEVLDVRCYRGKVMVQTPKGSLVLTKGQTVAAFDNRMEQGLEPLAEPRWLSGESQFASAPLQLVLAQVESQYGKKITYPEKYKNARFSGTVTHGDLRAALLSVCLPMHLTFTETADTITITE